MYSLRECRRARFRDDVTMEAEGSERFEDAGRECETGRYRFSGSWKGEGRRSPPELPGRTIKQ